MTTKFISHIQTHCELKERR